MDPTAKSGASSSDIKTSSPTSSSPQTGHLNGKNVQNITHGNGNDEIPAQTVQETTQPVLEGSQSLPTKPLNGSPAKARRFKSINPSMLLGILPSASVAVLKEVATIRPQSEVTQEATPQHPTVALPSSSKPTGEAIQASQALADVFSPYGATPQSSERSVIVLDEQHRLFIDQKTKQVIVGGIQHEDPATKAKEMSSAIDTALSSPQISEESKGLISERRKEGTISSLSQRETLSKVTSGLKQANQHTAKIEPLIPTIVSTVLSSLDIRQPDVEPMSVMLSEGMKYDTTKMSQAFIEDRGRDKKALFTCSAENFAAILFASPQKALCAGVKQDESQEALAERVDLPGLGHLLDTGHRILFNSPCRREEHQEMKRKIQERIRSHPALEQSKRDSLLERVAIVRTFLSYFSHDAHDHLLCKLQPEHLFWVLA